LHTNISPHPSSHDVNAFVAGGSGVENEKDGRVTKGRFAR
jgi:hypothetical protein